MATQKDITEEIERLQNLDILVKTYEEIAANHIRKIRSSVVQNRDFIEDIDKIFQELKASHTQEVLALQNKHKHTDGTGTTLMKHNGKTIAIFLAANTGLYGDVVAKTFSKFMDYITQNPKAEVAIIGKLGVTMFEARNTGRHAMLFDFPDNGTNQEELKRVIATIMPYEKILVFYGQFRSIVTQSPVVTDIYGEQASRNVVTTQTEHQDVLHYLFEPSLEKILAFFEAEIFASIFEQAINESQLAKNASRMKMLDSAMQNIGNNLKQQEQTKRRMQHRLMNSKQLNSLTGISLWKR